MTTKLITKVLWIQVIWTKKMCRISNFIKEKKSRDIPEYPVATWIKSEIVHYLDYYFDKYICLYGCLSNLEETHKLLHCLNQKLQFCHVFNFVQWSCFFSLDFIKWHFYNMVLDINWKLCYRRSIEWKQSVKLQQFFSFC